MPICEIKREEEMPTVPFQKIAEACKTTGLSQYFLRQGTEYLIDPLMAALEQYVRSHRVVRFPHYTICFVLVHDWNLPERRMRDYDNLELKQILDAAAAYLMYSDAGFLCDTYHSTELGEKDRMRMFIMDTKRYPQWYAERQAALKSREKQG